MESDTAPIRKHASVAAATIGLLLLLLAIDVGLGYRKLVSGDAGEHIEGVHEAHPRLGWALQAGSVGRHVREGSFDVRYRIDADGLRHVPNRGEPERDLWIFGDSFTFGHGVRDAETFAGVLAAGLLPDGVHVRNAGVMGYGLAQQLQRLIELEDLVGPGDVVLFAPISSDLERNLAHFRYVSRHLFREAKGRIERFPQWRDGRLVAAPLDTPGNRIRALLYHARFTGRGIQAVLQLLRPPPVLEEARAILRRAASVAEARGARFLLVFLPHPEECLAGRYGVDLSSFEFPDLMGAFPSDAPGIAAIRLSKDPHWNARGHALAAQAIARVLRDRGVFEGSP